MKNNLKKTLVLLLIVVLCTSSVSISATENKIESNDISETVNSILDNSNTIITIDCKDYNSQEFMNRVLDYTIESKPINAVKTKDGSVVSFEYNNRRQRIKKMTEEGSKLFSYDNNGFLKTELLQNGESINYSYVTTNVKQIPLSLSYKKNTYYYIIDDQGIITGLRDENNKEVCKYVYGNNGLTAHIYEIKGNTMLEHKNTLTDDFVGCVNSLRYDGKYYDSETGMFCTISGSYYDTTTDNVVGDYSYVDMKGLFGDQYESLSANETNNSEISPYITTVELQQLLYNATQYYNNNLNSDTASNSGSTWYTKYKSLSANYKLVARIIFAENTNVSSESNMNTFLKYNRQGIAWEIVNRYLEDSYRFSKGLKRTFSSTTTAPTFYDIVTYSSAFTSLNGTTAKGEMDASNIAYQQAFYLACCIKVCTSYDEWNAVVARPTGITSQCYNRGALSSSKAPNSDWTNVKFPGSSTDYTDKSSYSAFTYYSNISKFNILFSFEVENLYIESLYYNK